MKPKHDELEVCHTYSMTHRYQDPNYPLTDYGMSRAVSTDGQEVIFVFARPALKEGDFIYRDELKHLPSLKGAHPFFVRENFMAAAAGVDSSLRNNPADPKVYKPDTFKSPDEIRKITRGLC